MPENIGKVSVDILEKELSNVFSEAKRLDQPVYVSVVGKGTRKKFFNDNNYSKVKKCLMPWYIWIDPYGRISVEMGNLREKNSQILLMGKNM